MGGLRVHPGQELHRVEPGHGPDPESHDGIRAAVAGDAAEGIVLRMVRASEVGRHIGDETRELGIVEMARDAKPVVALLRRKPGKKKDAEPQPADSSRRDGGQQPADGYSSDSRRLSC